MSQCNQCREELSADMTCRFCGTDYAPDATERPPCPFALPVRVRESEHAIPEGPIERWTVRYQVISPYPNGYPFVLAEFSSRERADYIAAAINAYARPDSQGDREALREALVDADSSLSWVMSRYVLSVTDYESVRSTVAKLRALAAHGSSEGGTER